MIKSKIEVTVSKNEVGRDFVIGDIHAHKKRFDRALASVNFDKQKDRLFCVGDLIDRGNKPLYILDLLKEPWFFSIIGNHEQFILSRYDLPLIANEESLSTKGPKTRYEVVELHENHNGGKWFGKLRDTAKRNIYKALKQLPYAITLESEKGRIGIVHAEVPRPIESWSELIEKLSDSEVREKAIWNINAIQECYDLGKSESIEVKTTPRTIKGIELTVHGHATTHEPVIYGNQIWMDTGHIKNELTILEVNQLFEMI